MAFDALKKYVEEKGKLEEIESSVEKADKNASQLGDAAGKPSAEEEGLPLEGEVRAELTDEVDKDAPESKREMTLEDEIEEEWYEVIKGMYF